MQLPIVLVVLLASVMAMAPAARAVPKYDAIDAYVQSQVVANSLPGTAIAIVEGDTLVHAQGFGHDAAGQPVTAQTPFMIGSNTKSFTALSVMQLVEAGKVELDAPVQRYVPSFRVADARASTEITVRQLLNQTSGLPGLAAGQILMEFRPASIEDGIAALRDIELHAPPGDSYEYSNANFMLAGAVIEAASGGPYARYVQEHVFAPLGMTRTRLESGDAVGYRYWFGVAVADPMPYTSSYASVPTGGVVSTAEDMSRYLAMYLNGGELQGQRVISAAGIAEMERGVSRVSFTEGDRTITLDYGMGWAAGDIAGQPAVYHTGGSPQFASWMVLIPNQNRAYITLTNTNSFIPGPGLASTESIPKGIMQLLVGATPDQGTSLASMYVVLDAMAALVVGLILWSLVRVVRRPRQLRFWSLVPLVWEVGLGLGLLVGLPKLFEVDSWSHVMAYAPDIGALASTVGGLWLVTATARLVRLPQTVDAPRSASRVGMAATQHA